MKFFLNKNQTIFEFHHSRLEVLLLWIKNKTNLSQLYTDGENWSTNEIASAMIINLTLAKSETIFAYNDIGYL